MTSPRSVEIRAEAASWLARLRNEGRSRDDEATFQAWLCQSEDHRASFDAVNSTFELAGALKEDVKPRRHLVRLDRRAVLAGLGAAAVGAGWLMIAPSVYATGIGEMRRINLDDGSTILLDADSRIRVKLDGRQRRVTLVRGRAFFRAAGDPLRPFVVSAAEHEIVGGGGDAFDVRLRDKAVSAVALHGDIVMMKTGEPATYLVARVGQALVAAPGGAVRREGTDVQTASSWRFGRAVFNDQSLAGALVEMNRYSKRRIELADPELADLRISGVYKTGDNDAFARSAATLLNLTVRDTGGALVIARPDGG